MISRKWVIGLIAGLAAAATVGFVVVRMFIQHFDRELIEHKAARQTTGTIVDKQQVQFGADQTSYRDDEGRTIPLQGRRRTSGDFRIFYKIDNFDQVPNSSRSSLVGAERERHEKFGPRFTVVDQRTYEEGGVGGVVDITYRWAGKSKIEIVSVQLHSPKNQR